MAGTYFYRRFNSYLHKQHRSCQDFHLQLTLSSLPSPKVNHYKCYPEHLKYILGLLFKNINYRNVFVLGSTYMKNIQTLLLTPAKERQVLNLKTSPEAV